jgi:hypothetical protein
MEQDERVSAAGTTVIEHHSAGKRIVAETVWP